MQSPTAVMSSSTNTSHSTFGPAFEPLSVLSAFSSSSSSSPLLYYSSDPASWATQEPNHEHHRAKQQLRQYEERMNQQHKEHEEQVRNMQEQHKLQMERMLAAVTRSQTG